MKAMQVHNNRSEDRKNTAPGKREAEEFPELNESAALGAAHSPPPYSPFDQASTSFADTSQPAAEQQPAPTVQEVQAVQVVQQPQQPSNLLSINQNEYYHPASFPGYTVVRLANGEEETLLPRAGTSASRGDLRYVNHEPARHRFVRRRRHRGCIRRCCGQLFSCVCFLIGMLIVGAFIGSAMFISRQIFPPSWDWKCSNLEVHTDAQFDFTATQPLRIESIEGITISNVHLVLPNDTHFPPTPPRPQMSGREDPRVHVHVIVETNRDNHRDIITVTPDVLPGEQHANHLVVKAVRPGWEWPRDCIRATLYVSVLLLKESPAHKSIVMPDLHIATGTGSFYALDLDKLALQDLDVQVRNGPIQLRSLSVLGTLHASSTNGRVNVTDVEAGNLMDVSSSNGAVTLDKTTAPVVKVSTSNAALRISNVAADELHLHTTNGPVALHSTTADSATVSTSNASVRGDLDVGRLATVHTTNGAVGLHISAKNGTEDTRKDVDVRSSNASVSLTLSKIRGTFDIKTSNSRTEVNGKDDLIKLITSSNKHKAGVYGDENAGTVVVSSSNGRATLNFDDGH
ncbi:hypothetical protein GQ54DRAFT_209825 [Martensiomyces pterosporus]|nr:hypothetical protein GQ54DRAFT_209825 [Martensiomyces pterosporus]